MQGIKGCIPRSHLILEYRNEDRNRQKLRGEETVENSEVGAFACQLSEVWLIYISKAQTK